MSNLALTRGGVFADAADAINNAFGDLRAGSAKRAAFRKTRNELSALSNRELDDLGLSRFDIDRVAYESVYGPVL